MISEELKAYGEIRFGERKAYLDRLPEDIRPRLADCDRETGAWMKLIYGTCPLRDLGEYDFDVFLSYVNHSLWLRKNIKWCRDLPEDIFAHYVLYPRINSEDIRDCRAFFHDCLKGRVQGKTMEEAVLEVNYWCAEQVAYEASDERTLGPLSVYRGGKGRCGEESTFTVTALRSVGIPARQVYVPRWAHCDDNHAWVEVYVDGEWHFLGACEPEEILDRGWFLGASSRAMLVESRTFFNHEEETGDCRSRKEGMLWMRGSTGLYTDTAILSVSVRNREGNPVPEARVEIQILNMAEWVTCGTLMTDKRGEASIELGLGDVRVRAQKEGDFGWEKASLRKVGGEKDASLREMEIEVALEYSVSEPRFWADETWNYEEVKAPVEAGIARRRPTPDQSCRRKVRLEEAGRLRRARQQAYYRQDLAEGYPDMKEILQKSGGNIGELEAFLKHADSRELAKEREELLRTLADKDYRDVEAQVLEDFLPFRGAYISSPRVGWEELRAYPTFIRNFFDKDRQEAFRTHPRQIWDYIEENMSYDEEQNYQTLLSTPIGALTLGQANLESRQILFVAICRSLGISARKNPVTGMAEYGREGEWIPAGQVEEGPKASLRLHSVNWERLRYLQTWTLGQWRGQGFVTLTYEERAWRGEEECLELEPGIYRLIISNRMPNGNQQAGEITFCLEAGEEKCLTIELREGNWEDMLIGSKIEDFAVLDEEGAPHMISHILKGSKGVVAFLEEGAEPTEHILNEWAACAKDWKGSGIPLIWIVRGREALDNPTLKKTYDLLEGVQVFFDPDWENAESVARKMYVNPEGLPLALVLGDGLKGMYGSSGYNVGSVELLHKIWKELV